MEYTDLTRTHVPFPFVEQGKCFFLDGELFFRMEDVLESSPDGMNANVVYNAVSLEDGCVVCVGNSEWVDVVNASIKIK